MSFTTTLGTASAQVTIQPRLPVLQIAPIPIVISDNGGPLTLHVELLSADILSHTINLVTGNSTVATVSPSTITIPAGETTSPDLIQITGTALGITSLNITSTTLADVATTVFVTDQYSAPLGDNISHALPLGVVLTPPLEPPQLITRGPFSAELSILKESTDLASSRQITPIVSPSIGLVCRD